MASVTSLNCAGGTHQGKVRGNNEDRIHYDAQRGIFLVIDGVGGQAAGETAAETALSRARGRLERQTGTVEERLREAITVANNEILRQSRAHPEWSGMACVLTAAVVEDGAATVGHVGDCRLYKIRGGKIRKITHDHSPVGEREDRGELSEAEAMRHPRRNEVFRDVGSEEHAPDDAGFVELARIDFEPDSALLLCSDGLSDQVASARILEIVEQHAGEPHLAVRQLIEEANEAGGKDNVSVVIVEGHRFASAPRPVAAGAAAAPVRGSARGVLASGWLIFAGGLLAGALLFALAQMRWEKVPAPPPGPRVFTVGNSGAAAFASVAEALRQAQPGDTVEVLPGEYAEAVTLKERVTLRSASPRGALLAMGATAQNVGAAQLSGFRIAAGPSGTGLLLVNSSIEADDLEISGAAVGVEVQGGAPSLRSSYIHHNTGPGVLVRGEARPRLAHNVIAFNGTAPGAGAGLAIVDPAKPSLAGNVFTGNGAGGIAKTADPGDGQIVQLNMFLDGRSGLATPARPRGGARRLP